MATKTTRTAGSAAKAAPAPASEPSAPAAPARSAPAKATKAVRPQPAPDATPADDGGADEEQAPMNRAERRAKGRGKSSVQIPGGRGKVPGGHGPAHTHRNWANRRTG